MTLDSAQYQRSAAPAGSGPMTQVMGRKWMVAAGHPLAAQAAARVLANGGNAIDAGVAAGFMLGVVHPDMVSFAGVAPILVHLASTGETFEVSGVGPYPRRVSADLFRTKHAGEIPIGLLRTVVPASPDAWCVALERWGTRSFADSVSAALECAEHGFPTSAFSASIMANNAERYTRVPHLGQDLPAGRQAARGRAALRAVGARRDDQGDGGRRGALGQPRPGRRHPRRARRLLQGRHRQAHRGLPRARRRPDGARGPGRVPRRGRARAQDHLPRLRSGGVRLLVPGAGVLADAEPDRALRLARARPQHAARAPHPGGGHEARLRRPRGLLRRSALREGPGRGAALEGLRGRCGAA